MSFPSRERLAIVIFKSIFFFILSFNLHAFSGVEIELRSGEMIRGEYIETYEDRWFYQSPLPRREHFVLIFSLNEKKPHFDFIQLKDVKFVRLTSLHQIDLATYLKQHNLIFDQQTVQNASVLTGHEGHHKYEQMFGNFAWDFGILDQYGRQYSNEGLQLNDYYIFQQPVYSPFDGKIVAIQQDAFDNRPDPFFEVNLEGLTPNYILMLLHYPFYFSMVHFAQGSLAVEAGDTVKTGEFLGLVGNSGVSYTPHLHVTLFLYLEEGDRFLSIPVPSSRYPSRVSKYKF